MAINPNVPFTRQYVDLPTEVALKLEAAARAAGKTKKAFVSEAIIAAVERVAPSNSKRK